MTILVNGHNANPMRTYDEPNTTQGNSGVCTYAQTRGDTVDVRFSDPDTGVPPDSSSGQAEAMCPAVRTSVTDPCSDDAYGGGAPALSQAVLLFLAVGFLGVGVGISDAAVRGVVEMSAHRHLLFACRLSLAVDASSRAERHHVVTYVRGAQR